MIYSQNDLLKRILDTHALSIWNSQKGPVFWYAANVPGPFYVNTEKIIGKDVADSLLDGITAIVDEKESQPSDRAGRLTRLIMDVYEKTEPWKLLIATMVDRAKREFPQESYQMISGGERRDWLFSIPFAHLIGMPHLFLFKNGTVFCAKPLVPGQSVLHVSDLINNAASFFDLWQPALQKAQLGCCGNLCVNVRGENGLQRLREAGQKVVSLMTIDVDFFRHLHEAGLIAQETLDEIAVFFKSSIEWGEKYLIERPELFDASGCSSKSFERLKFFIERDPWKLGDKHGTFFADMKKRIGERMAKG